MHLAEFQRLIIEDYKNNSLMVDWVEVPAEDFIELADEVIPYAIESLIPCIQVMGVTVYVSPIHIAETCIDFDGFYTFHSAISSK